MCFFKRVFSIQGRYLACSAGRDWQAFVGARWKLGMVTQNRLSHDCVLLVYLHSPLPFVLVILSIQDNHPSIAILGLAGLTRRALAKRVQPLQLLPALYRTWMHSMGRSWRKLLLSWQARCSTSRRPWSTETLVRGTCVLNDVHSQASLCIHCITNLRLSEIGKLGMRSQPVSIPAAAQEELLARQ